MEGLDSWSPADLEALAVEAFVNLFQEHLLIAVFVGAGGGAQSTAGLARAARMSLPTGDTVNRPMVATTYCIICFSLWLPVLLVHVLIGSTGMIRTAASNQPSAMRSCPQLLWTRGQCLVAVLLLV